MNTLERDLTTPQGLYAEEERLKASLSAAGAKYPTVWVSMFEKGARLFVEHDGCASGNTGRVARVEAETFEGAFDLGEQAIRNWKVTRHDSVIRKMALTIIEITDDHTHCTETLLRGKGFSQADVAEYSEKACARAGEMCAGAPFSVEMA